MNVTDTRSTRIAVFIDFDNVEIGVKTTIGGQFDIGLVLEAIKERGEIVTKIAYSDWKRAGDYSRLLTQHAIRMVQRNLTPGGDKNGADITMALDALEMAFTHDHINAFVIVGGDSDFISLVEKLKQYGRKVIVVGGRQFTSATMQKNCHEFIAYENLVGSSRGGRSAERGGRPASGGAQIAQALPLVRRALKVLSEREVTPQLGLLKSTLLQLDSTFSERNYGASSFRDFMEKVAETGAVTLKQAGRSMLVEQHGDGPADVEATAPERPERPERQERPVAAERATPAETTAPAETGLPAVEDGDEDEQLPPSPMSHQDGIRAVQTAFSQAANPPRWPMYVRQAKQYLRSAIEDFDERKYGFASVVDLLRAAGKEGVLRIERDRQGAVRVFPGAGLEAPRPDAGTVADDVAADAADVVTDVVTAETVSVETVLDVPITDAEPLAVQDAPVAGGASGDDDDSEDEDDSRWNRPGAHESPRSQPPRPPVRRRKAPAPRAVKAASPAKPAARPRSRKAAKPKPTGKG